MSKSERISIIDKGLKVEGTVRARGRLIVAGEVEGTLVGETVVTVSGSRVRADAQVSEITIGGEFKGDITARERVIILSTGDVRGDLIYKDLRLEAGGLLNGRVGPIAEGPSALSSEQASAQASEKSPVARKR
jgi:cytoskeletal protein CcmA (bactofilin family)